MTDNKFLLGVVLAIFSMVGYVVLALSGNDNLEAARGVFLFVTPFIAILLGSSAYDKIKNIEKQTNGHLTKRIEDTADAAAEAAVKRVLEQKKD